MATRDTFRPVLERGHIHYFQPVARTPLVNGGEELVRQCVCGLEERRTYLPNDEHPYNFQFRFNGMWIVPLDLVRMLPVGVEECDDCKGEQSPLGICGRCGGLGVTENGERLGKPQLIVHR